MAGGSGGAATAGGAAGHAPGGSAGKAGGPAGEAGVSTSGGGSGGSGGVPDCLPPCLYELFAACSAQKSCTNDAEDAFHFVECEPDTGWRQEAMIDTDGDVPLGTTVVTIDGATCYTGSLVDHTWTYKGPDGEVVGSLTYAATGDTARCESMEEAGSPPVHYPIDRDDPRCAPIDCTEGTCP